MEYISAFFYCFLFVTSELVRKAPIEKEIDISLGGALNLHTLVGLTIFVGKKIILSRSFYILISKGYCYQFKYFTDLIKDMRRTVKFL